MSTDSPETAPVVSRPERVLVVDDDPTQRFVGSRVLVKLGYAAETAESGHQVIDLFEKAKEAGAEAPYDLVIMDMRMEPGLDGLQTYESIVKLFPKQKAIIASGFADIDRIETARSLGVGWLSKPYVRADMERAVREAMGKES